MIEAEQTTKPPDTLGRAELPRRALDEARSLRIEQS